MISSRVGWLSHASYKEYRYIDDTWIACSWNMRTSTLYFMSFNGQSEALGRASATNFVVI